MGGESGSEVFFCSCGLCHIKAHAAEVRKTLGTPSLPGTSPVTEI